MATERFFGKYWVLYYASFVGLTAYLGRALWWDLTQGTVRISALADVYTVAAGTSVLVTIFVEVLGRMVLLIPAAVKKIMEDGRREQRNREKEALARFGYEIDGVRVLPMTPEVQRFLSGESDESAGKEE